MPYWGLTFEEVIAAYTGTVEDDFDPVNLNGQAVIEAEMARQAAKMKSLMHPKLRDALTESLYEIVEIDASGNYQTALATLLVPDLAYLPSSGYLNDEPPKYVGCHAPSILYDQVSTEQVPGDFKSFTVTDHQTAYQYGVVRYQVYEDQLAVPSLAAMLLDFVACSLGRRLYPSGSEEWRQVTYYCEQAKFWMELLQKKTFLPVELANIERYWTPPIFSSFKVVRG